MRISLSSLRHAVCGASIFAVSLAAGAQAAQQHNYPTPQEGTYVAHNFHFTDGESLPELKLHYTTIGTLKKNAQGHVTNAVLVMHGTGGTGKQFLAPVFADVLFGPGQPLDATKYFIVLPDSIGTGGSSKPSDGMHAHFPKYTYTDMVHGQHEMLVEGLHVDHLRLAMGTSMGCMHSFMWGEMYPDFSDGLMPLACNTMEIAGRNRMTRKMLTDMIVSDPDYNNGDYTKPLKNLRFAEDILLLMGGAPLQLQKNYPTRAAADAYVDSYYERTKNTDPNDLIYQFDSSIDYNPSTKLSTIKVPLMYVNSADDFVNPPELGIAQQNIKLVPKGKFVLLPITDETRGHGTHTQAAIWKQYLVELLAESEPAK